jgi:DNA-binding CsgD family transcriptional regulator
MVLGDGEDLLMLSERDETVPAASRLERLLQLTRREAEVLGRLASGRTNDGIAYDLGISSHTVVRHARAYLFKAWGPHPGRSDPRGARGAAQRALTPSAGFTSS